MGTIILVRHGENDWSKNNKLAGRIPGVHLNENGHRQAHAVSQRLAALPIKAIYSSPVTRCVETAAYIADVHGFNIQQVDEVAEVEYGEWEGKKIKKLAKKPLWRAVQFFPSRATFPQGESLREVQHRAVQAVEDIAARHEKELVVVVSHADVIRLLLAHYLGVHIDLFQRLVIAPASVSVLGLSPDGMVRVLRVNDDGPLHMPSPPADREKGKAKGAKSPRPSDNRAESPEDLPAERADGISGLHSDNGKRRSGARHISQPTALDEEE